MCGLAGVLWQPGRSDGTDIGTVLRQMTDAITHRGPDADGHWTDEAAGIALGHRRLSILDLSEAGAQPMASASGRYMMVYNGETYNHLSLRKALEDAGAAPQWRGHSDTETLLAGVEHWGLEATLTRAEGMFAIALWDRETRVLTLARDRLGEKPLYYGWQGQGGDRVFLFGSELHALRQHPCFEGRIEQDTLVHFLRYGTVGQGYAIFDGMNKLFPGQMLTLAEGQGTPEVQFYWNGAEVAATRAGRDLSHLAPEEVIDQMEALLLEVISDQMISDVPLGAFLSGGIDSSLVVSLMQKLSSGPVHTFSIGFEEERYNEAPFARDVADHLGTRHTELYISEADLLGVVPKLPTMYDEPFSDPSQIPTHLVAKLAREHVTVALSGDGGDELFCGYRRYMQAESLWNKIHRVPQGLRAFGGSAMRALPKTVYNRLLEPLRATEQGKDLWGQRIHRLSHYAMARDVDDLHNMMGSVWRFPETGVVGGTAPRSLLVEDLPPRGDLTLQERMMQRDMLTYMVDDILAKVDRATMSVSLESRAPLLNHRVVEFAWGLPLGMKVRDGLAKWPLRQVLYRHVPSALIDRPKMGFEVPIGLWLRGGLKDWAGGLLEPDRLAREGYLNPKTVSEMWNEHLRGDANWGLQLWSVCMFQAWREIL